ncbi:unnamed protein product [Gongylonema pulchrum]|uniref:Transmembrane protein 208 n=1 Tax=Gongylonema pulchrum TaxID=637853 RepID=A0A183DYV4_9BILA|nr:unnamed protein product [Gongylonema pulchrum]
MNVGGAKVTKAATRGQKQIYEENKAVILHYSLAALLSTVFYVIISSFLFLRTTWEWVSNV